ncbi:MAG TPA: SWIM zinc finger family protein [Blastocatellia bacterium]|nr:SWIM zinc finger family protein [Blastocatellia bacterium]
MAAPKITEAVIRAAATERSFQRGLELFRHGAIRRAAIQGNALSGDCAGTQAPSYRVRAELDGGGLRSATCACPFDLGGYCKHVVALLLTYVHAPGQFVTRKEPAELLAELGREQLLALVTKLLQRQPDLYEWVEAEIAAPATPGPGKKQASKRKKVDAAIYRRRVRSIMHSLDHMRPSEAYWHVGGLAAELRGVQQTAMEFLNAGDAETALAVLLALLEESHDGFDYIDDSNGELGDFLSGIGEVLAEVILSMELDEERREDLMNDLDDLHEKLSDYGVEGLSVAIAAAKYGWDDPPAGEQKGEQIWLASAGEEGEDEWGEEWDEEALTLSAYDPGGLFRYSGDPEDALTRARLNVLERQGRVDDYLRLCLKAGAHLRYALKLSALGHTQDAIAHALKHFTMADEALSLAQELRETGHLDEAVRLGERGLQLGGRKAALGAWLGPIEEAQGRASQALAAWLAAFGESPSLALYQTVKRLAGREWGEMQPGLMTTLEKNWDKQPLVEVLLSEQQWDAAIKVADRKDAYYNIIATVADALIAQRPEWVISASRKQAEDLIARTQSKHYPAAADWLRKAKAAYAQLGRTEEWRQYLQGLKEQYKRRPALQAQLMGL